MPDKSASCQSIGPVRVSLPAVRSEVVGLSEIGRFSANPPTTWTILNENGKYRQSVTGLLNLLLSVTARPEIGQLVWRIPRSSSQSSCHFPRSVTGGWPTSLRSNRSVRRCRGSARPLRSGPACRRYEDLSARPRHGHGIGLGQVAQVLSNTVLGRLQTAIGALIVCHSIRPRAGQRQYGRPTYLAPDRLPFGQRREEFLIAAR